MADANTLDPMDPSQMTSLKHWGEPLDIPGSQHMGENIAVDCGWGRLLFGQTFTHANELVQVLLDEQEGRRDVAIYIRDPHVLISMAPQEIFLDPSHTYRLVFKDRVHTQSPTSGFVISRITTIEEGRSANRILVARGMLPNSDVFYQKSRQSSLVTLLLARDIHGGEILGVITGIDHKRAIDDPDNGSSVWSLAVDPQCPYPGVGEALVQKSAEMFRQRGRDFMDLSVIHDNTQAIKLYQKLGFQQVPVYSLKHKNCFNEKLFTGPFPENRLNIYARIIVDEARRRGISAALLDEKNGFFSLSLGGRTITCRESLSELTSAIAMSRCQDKAMTHKVLRDTGLTVPEQMPAVDKTHIAAFLQRHERVVVKPMNGEQGRGVSVDLRTMTEIEQAIAQAGSPPEEVLLEAFVAGEDIRIIVMDNRVVAAAIRRPAQVRGNGRHTVRELIEAQSRRRKTATHGESSIPMDTETKRCVHQASYQFETILPQGTNLVVRKTANLHTGGTIHDVTPLIHPDLADAAVRAAQALEIPVVGLDFMVPSIQESQYYIIEANERPGLANHEPQPTAECFIDLLFPQTKQILPVCAPSEPSR